MDMGVIAFSICLLIVIALFLAVLIKNTKNTVLLMIIIPAALIFGASSFFTIKEIMGQPVQTKPTKEFMFLEYYTDGKSIFVWLIERGEKVPVTVQVAYSPKVHEQLEKARQGKKNGKTMLGKFPTESDSDEEGEEGEEGGKGKKGGKKGKSGKGHGGESESDSLQIYEFVPQEAELIKE
jgi:hypothetical protein